jgi:tocopherol O-methyltransferase
VNEKAHQEPKAAGDFDIDAVRNHYDSLSLSYRGLWGEHIHHGYFEDHETPEVAQVKLVERLAARAGIQRAARVLDVGCGLGGSSLWLARNLGCSVLGLNVSPVQVAIATEKARNEGLEECAGFRVFDARYLNTLAESFDVVWVIECSEHLPEKERFISDCVRVLRRGGTLALCAWLKTDPPVPPEGDTLVAEVCSSMLCPHLASMDDYRNWMNESGFDRVSAEDITPRVKETWAHCEAILSRPYIKALLEVADERTRSFAGAFRDIRRAFDEGAMKYGMFTATKI